ncbi:ubiquitin family protein [Sesbania bispinosa]|nr:ubiquitin family protein [Sesbania bispinosa]
MFKANWEFLHLGESSATMRCYSCPSSCNCHSTAVSWPLDLSLDKSSDAYCLLSTDLKLHLLVKHFGDDGYVRVKETDKGSDMPG